MFSKACMYAIRAMVLIASNSSKGERVSLSMIVAETGAPSAFMAKVLQKLVHADLITSVKGHGGGFGIDAQRVQGLRLGDVVKAIDGDALFAGCALGFPKCDERTPCPIHDQVMRVREDLQTILGDTPISHLGEELRSGSSFLRAKLR